ncbi:MAG: response regulator [Synergistaceae bacterium]|jgi:signal transduction histidine kinase/CheY-like chemotaxis protein/HAMP domain-containing protein|nr:response regulator [Synergistaceae bacterium]
MRDITKSFRGCIESLLNKMGLGMRGKLIIIFVIIKVIPMVLLALIAWRQARLLGDELNRRTEELRLSANEALSKTGSVAVRDSVAALDGRATEDIERITTDTARRIAEFLYARDDDIRYLASVNQSEELFRFFLGSRKGLLIKKRKWKLAPDQKSWVPDVLVNVPIPPDAESSNRENDNSFHYRPPDSFEYENRPYYLEATFVDLNGKETIKTTTSDLMDLSLKDVSDRRNTYVRAETYFAELKRLKPGEIYVSDVIGAYVPSKLIGMYTPENANRLGIDFAPEEEAYAGRENPNGKRFKGLVRWATPVVENGGIVGYVTLALDHDHIMEFTDHIVPTGDRYTEIPSAYEGNYAFIWDYKCRSIAHPRHHSIVGYDPETGYPQVPWLEESIYEAWQASGNSYVDFIEDQPVFVEQSVNKRPAKALTDKGFVGLDGRYLNFAPQCTGWFDLTAEGGSGSFVILWSGLTKLTTAATIPYYTGQYGKSRRGFAFVTIGAGLDDFHRPAKETERALSKVIQSANKDLDKAARQADAAISANLADTTYQLVASAAAMIVLVVLIAIWMASVFTRSITSLIKGISRFRAGERHFRFNSPVKDELGTLADSFDDMADSIVASVSTPLTIMDMNLNILYMNDYGLEPQGKKLSDVLGKPYGENSFYPCGSKYCPITALREGREAEAMHVNDRYVRGSATYLTDKNDDRIGYIIQSTDLTEIVLEHNELRKTKMELERAVSNANRANEYKGEFLARMSHEIRTPMNAIMGMTNIVKRKLSKEETSPQDVLANVRQIETSSHHLLGLLNDVLDISKIEAGKMELTEEAVDVKKLAGTIVTIIRPRCEEKNIDFEISIGVPDGTTVMSDSLRLRQVMINLLGNAVKFTPECGTIEFSIGLEDARDGKVLLRFAVRDTGIGISTEVMASLFQPFEQGSSSVSKKYGGTGLGLAISRNIVRLLGGDIVVESEVGVGSVFSFSLWLPELRVNLMDIDTAHDGHDQFLGKRALLADDVDINRMIVIDLLSPTGIDIDEAEDGERALRMFESSPPNTYDIIYMDVQMPKMDGYESASAIRALDRPDAKTVPIVALTANAFKEDIDNSMRHGMNAHLAKPLDIEKMIEVTFKCLAEAKRH